jgi:hypothetical protein
MLRILEHAHIAFCRKPLLTCELTDYEGIKCTHFSTNGKTFNLKMKHVRGSKVEIALALSINY